MLSEDMHRDSPMSVDLLPKDPFGCNKMRQEKLEMLVGIRVCFDTWFQMAKM